MAENNNNKLGRRLWEAADQLRANSKLKSSEFAVPVLGLVFLRYADHKFTIAERELKEEFRESGSRRSLDKLDYQARGVMYLPEEARFKKLLGLPEGENVGRAINDAMKAIEEENEDLKGVLPKTYNRIENDILVALLRIFSEIPIDIEGDVFGKIYEYFLGHFAMAEGRRGGEFFTPTSIVKLIVEVIEPYKGRIFDPACGSGGMFVQSARFVEKHKKNPSQDISIFGQEKVAENVRLCRMNLAVHGLSGDIRQANSYYENVHNCIGRFDYVMANPPFNVDGVNKENIKDDPRYSLGIPRADNANYLWIQEFYSALNENGRAGFVMANSAADAGGSELEIRKKLIEEKAVDVVISIGPNFFTNVTLPCTLWFLDRRKKGSKREDKVLFIDARSIYRQVDRALRDFTPTQIEFISNIARLYREEEIENFKGSGKEIKEKFPDMNYNDVPGLCKITSIEEIEEQGWSLNPGRYVGVADNDDGEDFDFREKLEKLNEELELLNIESREIEELINENVMKLLEER